MAGGESRQRHTWSREPACTKHRDPGEKGAGCVTAWCHSTSSHLLHGRCGRSYFLLLVTRLATTTSTTYGLVPQWFRLCLEAVFLVGVLCDRGDSLVVVMMGAPKQEAHHHPCAQGSAISALPPALAAGCSGVVGGKAGDPGVLAGAASVLSQEVHHQWRAPIGQRLHQLCLYCGFFGCLIDRVEGFLRGRGSGIMQPSHCAGPPVCSNRPFLHVHAHVRGCEPPSDTLVRLTAAAERAAAGGHMHKQP